MFDSVRKKYIFLKKYFSIEQNQDKIIFLLDITKDKWERLMAANNWNAIDLRDNRYNQIVHMVSAANGAEEFYSTEVKWLRQVFIHNVLIFM